MNEIRMLLGLCVVFILLTFLPALWADFAVPQAGKDGTWEAEKAPIAGWKDVLHSWASGGSYVEPDGTTDAGAPAHPRARGELEPRGLAGVPRLGRQWRRMPRRSRARSLGAHHDVERPEERPGVQGASRE